MKYWEYAKIGEVVDISLNNEYWDSQMVQQVEKGLIYLNRINMPAAAGPLIHKRVLIVINRSNGYIFYDAVVEDHTKLDNIPVTVIRPVTEVSRRQRRNAFRLSIDLKVHVLEFEKYDTRKAALEYDTVTTDISETGICIKTSRPVEFDTFVCCEYKIGEEELARYGRVARCVESRDENKVFYIGICFFDRDEALFKKIRKFIFDWQKHMKDNAR